MRVIGQPETYSDILVRVFVTTLVTGVICTAVLAVASPEVKRLLDSIGTEAELGPIKSLKLLYVAIPALFALFSRVIKLHDRVSDILRLRCVIDTRWILVPLAEGVALQLDDARRVSIKRERKDAMYQVFYPYVSLPDAKIDRQLVRSALDNIGWFWAAVEATVLLVVTTILLYLLDASGWGLTVLVAAGITTCFCIILWMACKRTTTNEVRGILQDPERRAAIRAYFERLWSKEAPAPPSPAPTGTTVKRAGASEA